MEPVSDYSSEKAIEELEREYSNIAIQNEWNAFLFNHLYEKYEENDVINLNFTSYLNKKLIQKISTIPFDGKIKEIGLGMINFDPRSFSKIMNNAKKSSIWNIQWAFGYGNQLTRAQILNDLVLASSWKLENLNILFWALTCKQLERLIQAFSHTGTIRLRSWILLKVPWSYPKSDSKNRMFDLGYMCDEVYLTKYGNPEAKEYRELLGVLARWDRIMQGLEVVIIGDSEWNSEELEEIMKEKGMQGVKVEVAEKYYEN
jgi:hypothetical protein